MQRGSRSPSHSPTTLPLCQPAGGWPHPWQQQGQGIYQRIDISIHLCWIIFLPLWVYLSYRRRPKKFISSSKYQLPISDKLLITVQLKKCLKYLVSYPSGQIVNISEIIEQSLGLKRCPQREYKRYFLFLSLLHTVEIWRAGSGKNSTLSWLLLVFPGAHQQALSWV